MALLKVGALVPERAGDDVHDAVTVEITEGRALAKELVAELKLAVGGDVSGKGGERAEREADEAGDHGGKRG